MATDNQRHRLSFATAEWRKAGDDIRAIDHEIAGLQKARAMLERTRENYAHQTDVIAAEIAATDEGPARANA